MASKKNGGLVHKKERLILPVKRSVNLAGYGEKPLNLKIAVPGIILIILAAVLLSKFAVVDRLTAMSRAQREAAQLRSELNEAYAEMDSYGDMQDVYAHYTYSDMTAAELSRVERTEVVDLIQRVVVPRAQLGPWSVKDNTLTITVSGGTLQEINKISQLLNQEAVVDFCTVSTAAMSESKDTSRNKLTDSEEIAAEKTPVTANIIVYLKMPEVSE